MLYIFITYNNLAVQIMSNLSNKCLCQKNQIGLKNTDLAINLSRGRMNIQISLKYSGYICISIFISDKVKNIDKKLLNSKCGNVPLVNYS